jgi:hypothetical protein
MVPVFKKGVILFTLCTCFVLPKHLAREWYDII